MHITENNLEKTVIVFFIFLLGSVAFWTVLFRDYEYVLTIDKQSKPVNIIGERFLSVGLDTIEIMNGVSKLHLNSSRLLSLTSHLGPAYLRLGGTLSDRLIFLWQDSNEYEKNSKLIYKNVFSNDKSLPFFIMTSEDWIKINLFCKATNMKLLFDFNVLLRNESDWDPTNAIDIILFSKKHNFDIDWQLGNEPNSFKHVFNVSISPQQLSKDFSVLRKLLKEHFPNSLLVGPDTTRPQPNRPDCVIYMKEFLEDGSKYIDAMAWHQYYLNGRIATLDDFWNPDVMDLLQSQIDTMIENTSAFQGKLKMWLTETSSAYGGGAPGLSNSFASTALWLDKLGMTALNGFQVVVRQSIIGANYSLIDKDLNPLPDWWVSILFKKLVGHKVVSCGVNATLFQRFYCHCSAESSGARRGVTIYGMNLRDYMIELVFNGNALSTVTNVDEYVLSPPNKDRRSKDVLLNGIKLIFNETALNIHPRRLGPVDLILLEPYSIGFWVLYDVDIDFCNT